VNAITSVAARPIVVRLDGYQTKLVTWVGLQRSRSARAKRRSHVFPATEAEGAANDIQGAGAEFAVAHWLGHRWDWNIGVIDGDDVGPVQVRLRRKADGGLIIRERDAKHFDDPWVLVTGTIETGLTIRGWLVAREALRIGVHCDPGDQGAPCWIAPQTALRPMPELLDRLVRGDRAGWQFLDL
jgi:hypothetical protein